MGSKKSSSASTTATNLTDNRLVAGEGSTALGTGASLSAWSWSDDDFELDVDSSNRSTNNTSVDSSNRSVTTIHNADAAKIAEFNSGLLRGISADQTDAVKSIAGFGAEQIQRMGESVTDLYGTAGSNTTRAWETTMDASEKLIGNLLQTTSQTTDAARAIAGAAISGFQPGENKNAEVLKYGAIAAAAIAALMLVKKA